MEIREAATRAKEASIALGATRESARNAALLAIAKGLEEHAEDIVRENAQDMDMAQKQALAQPMQKRLFVDRAKVDEMVQGVRALAALPDPIGHTQLARELAPGLDLYRVSCPIGVVGVIFESRPDALVQIACLCLKSGNAALLKGGREAMRTNRALFDVLHEASLGAGMSKGWAALLETREEVGVMLALDDVIDLIIPRGSNEFVRYIKDNSRIPVLGHADGICHVYIDKAADTAMAVRVAVDAKAQYVAVCNACETLLIHAALAQEVLPTLLQAMKEKGVTLRGDERVREIIDCAAATEEDWATEYLDYTLSVKVVDSEDEAIAHINRYGSGHTDVIITQDMDAARRFTLLVDSAGVFVNCSSRFADGFRYGFGAEVGIATGKVHARGPMGMEGLCIYKYKLIGHGQIVEDFAQGHAQFTHKELDGDCPL